MLRIITPIKRWFSNTPSPSNRAMGQLDPLTQQMLDRRRDVRREIRKKEQQNVPAQMQIRNFYDSLVNITLYMQQDQWKSQYVYLLLNYHQLGFRRISDLVFLDRASYFLDFRKVKEEERWPAVKVVVALEPVVTLRGIDPIAQFFKENEYFDKPMSPEKPQQQSVQDFIDSKVVPNLESLFWHPLLTYQYTFHTNLSSYADSKVNSVFGILRKNGALVLKRMLKNMTNIAKENERYKNSRENLKQALNQIVKGCLQKQDFIGGNQPGRLDFYLMAHLRSRSNSQLFMRYLQRDIGGAFWSWWLRVSNLCQYNPERITTL